MRIFSSLILGTSRRANTKRSSLTSEESGGGKRQFVKRQTPSLLPAPLPKANYKTQMTMPLLAQDGKGVQSTRALHCDGDYNDNSEREQRRVGDDRALRRLQRQELLSWLYVIVCATTITSTWRRMRDRLPWSLPQEHWHKEKGATTTQ